MSFQQKCGLPTALCHSCVNIVAGEAADEKFKQKKFHVGKIYPCVGFDVEESGVGLRFEVNFGQSLQHPFAYQGPEIDQQGNIEHMIWMTETRSTEGEGEGGY